MNYKIYINIYNFFLFYAHCIVISRFTHSYGGVKRILRTLCQKNSKLPLLTSVTGNYRVRQAVHYFPLVTGADAQH